MNITVLGCGNIGGTLARKWAAAGHRVVVGVRHPDEAETRALVAGFGPNASLTDIPGAIPHGQAVLFAIPGSAVEAAVSAAVAENAAALAGKIVIDATNKVGQQPAHNLAAFRQHAPSALWYRAFNTLGWESFADPRYGDQVADLFFCGAPGASREIVEGLIRDIGPRPVYVGGADQAETVDALLRLWMALVRGQGLGRGVAFKMLRR